MGKALDVIIPIVSSIAGFAIGGPPGAAAGAALGSGGVNYSQTHNFGSALKAGALSGAGSFVGGNIGGSLLGSEGGSLSQFGTDLGSVGDSVGTAFGSGASSDIASALGSTGSSLMGAGLGRAIGSAAGDSIASSFAPQGQPSNFGNYPYAPSQYPAAAAPKSLNSMSSLTQGQQASGLATQGVYGGGNGPDEQGYYANLLNRQLTTGGTQPLSSLSPIEQSYNSKLGFGNEPDTTSLLGALHQWQPNYA